MMSAAAAAAYVVDLEDSGRRAAVMREYRARVVQRGPHYSDRDYSAADAWLVDEVAAMRA